eukprot:3333267-Pyramimonas_sp.AAC.1
MTAWDYDKTALALQKGKYRKEFNGAQEFYIGKHQDKQQKLVGDRAADECGELIVNIMKEAAKPFFERLKPELDQCYQLMKE